MRLAAQAKMGFYPIHPHVAKLIASHLQVNEKRPDLNTIVDPCMGKGEALKVLSESLGIPEGNVHGVELDDERFAEAKKLLPGARLEGPASFFGVLCSPHSWSVAYVNPPFDDEIGGGRREEYRFLEKILIQMSPGGIMVLVCPWNVMRSDDVLDHVASNYEDIRIYKAPDGCDENGNDYRPHNEIVCIAKRRSAPLPRDLLSLHSELHKAGWGQYYFRPEVSMLPEIGSPWFGLSLKKDDRWGGFTNVIQCGEPEAEIAKYKLPSQSPPRVWKKYEATEKEIQDYLKTNPLDRHLQTTPEPPIDRPPLPVGRGHCAMLLASGRLDGIVEEDGGGVHVVRGTAKKEEYLNADKSKTTENPETGATKIVVVYSQKPVIVLRAVDQDGEIYTFTDGCAKADDESPDGVSVHLAEPDGSSIETGQQESVEYANS